MACAGCLVPLTAPARPAWPRPSPAGLPPPYAVAVYDGSTRDFLLAYKERGVVGLRRSLGRALGAAVVAALPDAEPVWVVPVPSRRVARRQRGDDVVAGLARHASLLARRQGRHVQLLPALRHLRAVADSAGLDARQRARNLSGAFGLRRGAGDLVRGTAVIVVDDLITTGATAVECAAALRGAGARVLAVATVAATARRADRSGRGLHNGD